MRGWMKSGNIYSPILHWGRVQLLSSDKEPLFYLCSISYKNDPIFHHSKYPYPLHEIFQLSRGGVCFPPLESGMALGLALAHTVWQRWRHAVSEPGASGGLICSCLLSLVHLNLENKTRITAGGWETRQASGDSLQPRSSQNCQLTSQLTQMHEKAWPKWNKTRTAQLSSAETADLQKLKLSRWWLL